ncbi:flagellar motor control protein ZomB [Gordonia alkanivorans]|uniref:flagellar motor control protein ZomB n=1 Tax=Gordonia alkanivorans TaxID=84096 RepID=UPI00244CB84A|nr:flagellar motor control protein ZomB [Gordonia alkanivorans]MDH3022375.1 flagellar motor control protein ZomB [Gordonia alkanivorans]
MQSIDGLQSTDGVGSDSVDEPEVEGTRASGTPVIDKARRRLAAVSFLIGAVAVSTFFAIGAWQRRWIADDGLIVLRTLRNLFAGNGPVFNAGERVEANTSTAWTYLLWFWAWVTDGQLEYVALWVALVCSVAAIPIAMYGSARLYGNRLGGITGDGWTLLLPFGAIIYIAIPPARDFATSGLENGLCIFWAAVLWCQLVAWARRGPQSTRKASAATLALAFTAGLAPLIRPELTVFGGLVLVLVFFAPLGWKMRLGVAVVAGALPVGYQIFRMGYYALLVPNPAVAKDASGAKWEQGFAYLTNLFGPYILVLPVVMAVVAGVILIVGARLRADAGASTADTDRSRPAALSARLQSSTAVVTVVAVAGLVLIVYWIRQGGDFMHGRVLLVPLFVTLLPLMVVPLTVPAHLGAAFGRRRAVEKSVIDDDPEPVEVSPAERRRTRVGLAGAVAMAGLWITVLVWGISTHANVLPNAGIDIGRSGIVDERRFYVTNMGNENPVTAEDYLAYPRMSAMVEKIDKYREDGGVILPSFNYDEWYVAQLPAVMPRGAERKVTVYFLNLGMTSMNAPLDVRVIDQMGLAYPLAAHTERLEDGRIGHDKILPSEWVVAEAGAYPRKPVLPGYLDEDLVRQAQVALQCPETKDRFASFEGPWSFTRFKHNLKQAFTFNSYRIQREPEYEIARCGLEMPPPVNPD